MLRPPCRVVLYVLVDTVQRPLVADGMFPIAALLWGHPRLPRPLSAPAVPAMVPVTTIKGACACELRWTV